MLKDRFLGERARNAIRREYQRDAQFIYLKKLSQQAEESAGEALFVLSAEDLFYLTVVYAEQLLEFDNPHDLTARQEAEGLWTEVKLRLRNEKNPSESDLNTAATLVAMAIHHNLCCYDPIRYWDLCESITNGIDMDEVLDWDRLTGLVDGIFMNPENLQYLHAWWLQEVDNPDWLSDELEDLIAEAGREDSAAPEIPNKAVILQDLKPFFWENEVKAETFLLQIYGKTDESVAVSIVSWRKKKNEINLNRKIKAFHKVLQAHRLYQATYDNLAKQIQI